MVTLGTHHDSASRWRPNLVAEPDVASSDPTNLRTSIVRDGDHYVINGRKWFNTGAMHPRARVLIVLGVTDDQEATPAHNRQSFVIVPIDTPGFRNRTQYADHEPSFARRSLRSGFPRRSRAEEQSTW
jgi:alkylation response protein AidB-like acyl-CoA dehydrogenase